VNVSLTRRFDIFVDRTNDQGSRVHHDAALTVIDTILGSEGAANGRRPGLGAASAASALSRRCATVKRWGP
jgi:hypothetical protein